MGKTFDRNRLLTLFYDPNEIVKGSGYGDIPFVEWCRLEIDRMNRCGGHAVIVTDDEGLIALTR